MRQALSKAAWRVAPDVMADRAHRYLHALDHRRGVSDLSDRHTAIHGDRVLRGPFAGMRYPARRVGSIQKRIGSYELELCPWLEQALANPPARFVDVGAADGFYAVGVARRGIPVEAFEMARTARAEIRELADANDVTVAVRGRATVAALARLDFADALVLSDCEGVEVDLFTPAVVDCLRLATVVVEVHESIRPGAGAVLRERFGASHAVEVAQPVKRDIARFPELLGLDASMRERAVDEMRTGATPWYRLSPREGRR